MADEKAPEAEEGKKKKGKKAILIPVLVLLLGLGGGGYFFLFAGKKKAVANPGTTTTTALGPIIRLDPITLNLSDGHVLKVGIALQTTAKPKEKEIAAVVAAKSAGGEEGGAKADTASPLGGLEAKALDLAIKDLGDMTFEELSKPGGRSAAKDELAKEISETYEGDIVQVYFTNFVMS